MDENEVQKLRQILIARPTTELEIINKVVIEILAVRKEIATKEQENRNKAIS